MIQALFYLMVIVVSHIPENIELCMPRAHLKSSAQFYQDKERGWFWYELKPVEIEEIEASKTEDSLEQEAEKKQVNAQQEETKLQKSNFPQQLFAKLPKGLGYKDGRLVLYSLREVRTHDLKTLIPQFLEQAIDSASADDVFNYFFLQKLAMDKSSLFEQAAQLAILGAPMLDEMPGNMVSTEARLVKSQETQKLQTDALRRIAHRAGLFFYYKGSCRYCKLAAQSIRELYNLGFKVFAISLDGEILPDLKASRLEVKNEIPEELGITSVPAIVYVEPNKQPLVISTGLLSHSELCERILRAGGETP